MQLYRKLILTGLALCLLWLPLQAADGGAAKELGDLLVQDTPATHYIWTDKYAYTVGENHTLRWTYRRNNDPYPYTLFVYRENLQTGQRMYLDITGPRLAAGVTDAFGNTSANGYAIQQLPEATKLELISGPVPSQVGYYQFVAEIRDFTGTRVVRAAYAKFAVVESFEVVPGGDITTDTTWPSTKAYRLTDTLYIRSGATLTIEPGTFVFGAGNTAVVVATQGGKLVAAGTKARPIVFSCDLPIGQRTRGCWGGLVLLGRAPINREGGVDFAEGLPNDERGQFGGSDPADNSGRLSYVRVEFAGIRFSPENELNGIAFHGVGNATQVDHCQVHQGLDDGVEFFGGTVNAKYLVLSAAADDSLDWVLGWQGNVQYVFVKQKFDDADRGIEADNLAEGQDNTPRSMPNLYNVTLVGDPRQGTTSSQGILLREGTAGRLNNFVVVGFGGAGLRVVDDATFRQADEGTLAINGMILWQNNGGSTANADQFHDAATAAFAASQQNVVVGDPGLRKPFDLNDPDPRPVDGAALGTVGLAAIPPDNSFLDTGVQAQCLGAFCPGAENWIEGWTYFLQEEDIVP